MIKYRLKVAFYDAKCQALHGLRYWQNLWTRPATDRTYLFLLCPPYSGSTLLHELISGSSAVSANNVFGTREGMSLPGVRQLIDHREEWNPAYAFPWPKIKEKWLSYWDRSKTVLLDKSPAAILRAQDIAKVFDPVYFLALVRHPLAHAESLMRRNKLSPKAAATFVIELLLAQRRNLESCDRIQLIRYENLVQQPDACVQVIQDFLPVLGRIDHQRTFKSHNQENRPMPITDFNQRSIQRLSREDLREMVSVLHKHEEILSYFGYPLDPDLYAS